MAQSSNNAPLKEFKHAAVPGYFTIFMIVFVALGLYLAVILISSPGSAKKAYHNDNSVNEANSAVTD